MSKEKMNSIDLIIEEYLNNVKAKLPEWLKWREKEIQIILDDLREQILVNAKYFSEQAQLDENAIKKAIAHLGTPQSIAKKYKKRGTPKFFISEELFEVYLRVLSILIVIVVLINFLIGIFQIFRKPWWELVLGVLSGSYIGIMIAFIVVTVVFTYLSMEGFLPEDFEALPKSFGRKIKEYSKEPTAEQITPENIQWNQIKQQSKEEISEIRRETKQKLDVARQEWKESKTKKKKKFYEVKVGDLIGGAIFGILFGLFFMLQPFLAVYSDFNPSFLYWLSIFGLLIFIGGVLNLIRLAIGTSIITGQQIIMVISIVIRIAFIPLFIWLYDHPEVFPILLFSGFTISSLTGNSLLVFQWFIIFIIAVSIIGMIVELVKVIRMSSLKK